MNEVQFKKKIRREVQAVQRGHRSYSGRTEKRSRIHRNQNGGTNMTEIMFRCETFNPFSRGFEKVLSPLESEIMETIWENYESGPVRAKEIYELLGVGEK